MKDITIFAGLYNRPEYTEESLLSLGKVLDAETKVMLLDDMSAMQNYEKSKAIVQSINQGNITLKRMDRNYGDDELFWNYPDMTDSEFIYISNNDILYGSKFMDELLKARLLISAMNGKCVISLYNSDKHESLKAFRFGGTEYLERKSIGGISLLLHRDTLKGVIEYNKAHKYNRNNPTSWDWGAVEYFNANNIKMVATNNSYVQHIGEYGLHTDGVFTDNGLNFIP